MTTFCRVLGVNRSTYYKFRNRKDSHRAVENRVLRAKILALYIKSDKRLVSQKMTECLAREYRIHIRAGSRFYYLCSIMDLFSRRIIAFRLSAQINTDLAIATLEDAIRARDVSASVMFHTDRDSQFTAKRFRQFLDQHDMIQSFSAKGYPYDNAVMECFFRYLKHEETNRHSYSSLSELQDALFRYIHGFYNSMRTPFHNNGLPPITSEAIIT